MDEVNEEHLDPTHEISLETVKERSVRGVIALTGRYFVLYLISTIAQALLGAFLTREFFGIFGVVSAVINFLVYFSDVGLAAALIQKKEKVTQEDLKTTFTIQQILVISLLIILVVASPFVRNFYKLNDSSMVLLYALGISFFFSSLKTIPSVLLERNLRFEKIALSNILETIVYNVALVFFAWKGFGITSFTIAVLLRAVTGLVTLYSFQPWKPGITISRSSLKKLLVFGVPYQINTFIAVLKDDGLTLVLGGILGFDAMGILVWAQKWIQVPLRVVMDTVTKVTFPAFARMQDEKSHLERSVTRSIFFITFLVFPATVGIVLLAPVIFTIIPQYQKWMPAILPFTLLAINVLFASVTTQLTNLLNSIGKIKITSFLMVMWTVLTWIFVPALAKKFGVNGAAIGYAIVGASSVVAIIIAKKYVNFSLSDSVVKPGIAAALMGVVLLILRGALPYNFYTLWILVAVGVVVYGVLMVAIIGASLIEDAKRSFKTIFPR